MSCFNYLLSVPAGAFLALGFAAYLVTRIMKFDEGTDKMKEIASAVRIGSKAYLKRQNSIVSIFFGMVFFLLWFLSSRGFLPVVINWTFSDSKLLNGAPIRLAMIVKVYITIIEQLIKNMGIISQLNQCNQWGNNEIKLFTKW